MSALAELMVFGAARAELVETVIRPNLESNTIVVADRYSDSTVAYQQYGRGLPGDTVQSAIALATSGLKPDITFFLDLMDLRKQRSLRRQGQAQGLLITEEEVRPAEVDDGTQARFESESREFHRRVRDGYRAMAKAEPKRWVVMDAAQSIGELHQRVRKHLTGSLPQAGPKPAQLLNLTIE